MSLTTKIAAILSVLILSLSAAGGLMQQRAFGSLFSSLELENASKDLRRVRGAVDAEVQSVVSIADRYAAWAPSVRFLAGSASSFADEHMTPEVMRAERVDLLYFCAPDGHVVGGEVLDPATGERTSLRNFPDGQLNPRHPMLAWFSGSVPMARREGIMLTEREPLLVAARRVDDVNGQPLGVVVVGRFLADGLSERVSALTEVEFDAFDLEDPSGLPADVQPLLEEVTASARPVFKDSQDGSTAVLAAYAVLDDVRGRPTLLVRARCSKAITAAGSTALLSGAMADAALGLVILLGLLASLHRIVLRPIRALTEHAVRTGRDENFRAEFGDDRDDEIGTLGREFDQMMAKLEQARSALVETARTAGMSEIATGILHNVGNVLNSVNISASLVSQRVDGLCIDDLERLSEVLEEHKEDLPEFLATDPRGQHIQPFLSALVVQLGEEQKTIRGEVASLADGIDHICELIKSQQSLAKGTRLIEPTDLAERIDEAIRITQRVQGVDPELVIVRRFDDLPLIELDKHKLLEILVNLVQNARQAMQSVTGTREMVLELRCLDGERVHIAVQDSGIGIAPDTLQQVFSMGFTTREEGHGFGLHSSANAASEMGGTLKAMSDGPGRGAKFVLELPRSAPGRAAERPKEPANESARRLGGAA